MSRVGMLVLAFLGLTSAVLATTELAVPNSIGQPLQLINADPNGEHLEALSGGLELLAKITTPVHVVSVVGGFHTGKSFLLNRLLNLPPGTGFPVGSSVDPETQGAWLWSEPKKVDGALKYPVLFVDSEGFSAPGNTATYDAKMFAVVTLLSSHLLYNSVRLIDQREIEYLEMYTRRTQMFQVRAQISSAAKNVSNPSTQLPDLTWVVQDFLQELRGSETSTDWLDRLLGSQRLGITDASGTSEMPERAVHRIFRSINCKTLFVPTLQGRRQLRNMNDRGVQLTNEYKDDLASLRTQIIVSLKDREQDPSSMKTGTELAAYTQLLVEAANRGLLSKVKSLWESFLLQQVAEAGESAHKFFTELTKQSETTHPPLGMTSFEKALQTARTKALNVYDQLLIGLNSLAATDRKSSLGDAIARDTAQATALNKVRIEKYLDLVSSEFLEEVKDRAKALSLPQGSAVLSKKLRDLSSHCLKRVAEVAAPYPEMEAAYAKRRTRDVSTITETFVSKNNKLLEQILADGESTAARVHQDKLDQMLKSHGSKCVPSETLRNTDISARATAMKHFEAKTNVAKDEANWAVFKRATATTLTNQHDTTQTKNGGCITKLAVKSVEEEVAKASENLEKCELPMIRSAIESTFAEEARLREQSYLATMGGFKGHSAVQQQKKTLFEELKLEKEKLMKNNAAKVERLITRPLRKAKNRMDDLVGSYWLTMSFKSKCRAVAKQEVKEENQLPPKFDDFLDEAIEHWLDTDMTAMISGLWWTTALMIGGVVIALAAVVFMVLTKR